MVRERQRAIRQRDRFERDLDQTRALLERRTIALRRLERRVTQIQAELDRFRSDPVVTAWRSARTGVARLRRAPGRLRRIGERLGRARGTGQVAVAGSGAVVDRRPPGEVLGLLRSGSQAAGDPPRVAVAGPTDAAVDEAIRTAGWHAAAGPDRSSEVVLVLHPASDVSATDREVLRVAWIRDDVGAWLAMPWLDDLDLVLVGPGVDGEALEAMVGAPHRLEAASGLPAALAEHAARPRLVIQIGPATWEGAGHWGDTAFARAVERAFRRRGWATCVLVDDERDGPRARDADVALHVVGVRQPPLHPDQTHLLWIISHPDAVRPEHCDRYDAVFVASDPFAEQVGMRVSVPVIPLHQATDPHRFFPEAGGPAHELLFVGNAKARGRPVIDALADTPWDLAVYGTSWRPELLDPRRLRGEWIPNEILRRYYAAAAIVLNDHWTDMRDEGFFSNRIYDALASGAFVLSDEVPGIEAEFGGGLATWRDEASLRAAVERYLPDVAARQALAARGRQAVLERHTFDRRVDAIIETIQALKSGPAGIARDE
ncbi:MAG TPA: glycosyltransferase [Candidatus Limnocylindrales bacterium]|nr:glycosyltransferase [Candidatus Limnocylindrales bacterium]